MKKTEDSLKKGIEGVIYDVVDKFEMILFQNFKENLQAGGMDETEIDEYQEDFESFMKKVQELRGSGLSNSDQQDQLEKMPNNKWAAARKEVVEKARAELGGTVEDRLERLGELAGDFSDVVEKKIKGEDVQ